MAARDRLEPTAAAWMKIAGRTHPLDPLLPVMDGRFEVTKIANFPTNEYWR
jgi:hypothetical protein